MSSVSALSTRENREHNGSSLADNGEVSDTKANVSPEAEANQRALLVGDFNHSSVSSSENVRRFLETLDKLGISGFAMSDLEKGCMKPIIGCLSKLRAEFSPTKENFWVNSTITKSGNSEKDASSGGLLSPVFGEERRKVLSESQFQGASRISAISEQSAALLHHVGHKFHEVFQLKQGPYSDLPAAKISEMMKSNTLECSIGD
ncbi:hypothetical protein Pint_16473 [Pistacia integerrima]|uniref:Uncharacterized protein n=1 Tax=Pistacia integerrima TaxID=434235 RepID=A0ACC0ZBP7_9ROSI|nr:hypothetical protein Pint_16473 [Pistacia integerrima]